VGKGLGDDGRQLALELRDLPPKRSPRRALARNAILERWTAGALLLMRAAASEDRPEVWSVGIDDGLLAVPHTPLLALRRS